MLGRKKKRIRKRMEFLDKAGFHQSDIKKSFDDSSDMNRTTFFTVYLFLFSTVVSSFSG